MPFYHIKDSSDRARAVGVPAKKRVGKFHLEESDEIVDDDDEEILEEIKFQKMCASGYCSSMPTKQKMQIKVSCKKSAV